jgi:hypothetical protein
MRNKKLLPLLLFLVLLTIISIFSTASLKGINPALAKDKATSYADQIRNNIATELAKEAQIIITAKRSSTSNTTTIAGTVTNVSSSVLQDLLINGMTIIERDATGFRYSVLDIFEEQKVQIATLAPGESLGFSFTLSDINWEANRLHGVIFVQAPNSLEKEILQALYIE